MTIERPGGSSGDNGANDPYIHDSQASVMDWVTDNGNLQTPAEAPEELDEDSQLIEYDPDQLLESLRVIQDNDHTMGFRIDSETKEKVLEIFDQLAKHPEAVKEFLGHEVVSQSPMFDDQQMLMALPKRNWEKEGGLMTPIQLLAFALERSSDPIDIVQSYADAVWPKTDTQVGRLKLVMQQVEVVSSGLTAEELKSVVDNVDLAIRTKREAEAAERGRIALIQAVAEAAEEERKQQERRDGEERGRKSLEEKNERARQMAEWKELSEELINNPEGAYGKYHANKYGVYKGNRLAELSVASRYLTVTNGEGDANLTAEAIKDVRGHLNMLLLSSNEKNVLSKEKAFEAIKPHLHRFYPDLESLNSLIADYPSLRNDGEFFSAWKKAFTDDKLRKNAEALVGKFGLEKLKNQDIDTLIIRADQYLGVPYASMEEMLHDMERYFVQPLDGAGKVPEWSKSNRIILKNIYEQLKKNTLAKFVSPESVTYGDATNDLNGGQCFTVSRGKSPDGKPAYYLLLNEVHNYAAFFDKEVVYRSPKTEYSIEANLAPLPAWTKEKETLEDLHNRCHISYIPIVAGVDKQKSGGSKEETETWRLRYDHRPNQTIADLLKDYLGKANITYQLDDNEKRIRLNDSRVPEVEEVLEATFYTGVGLGARPLKSREVTRKMVAKFNVFATPEQAKVLEALKVALPQSRPPLPEMLY